MCSEPQTKGSQTVRRGNQLQNFLRGLMKSDTKAKNLRQNNNSQRVGPISAGY